MSAARPGPPSSPISSSKPWRLTEEFRSLSRHRKPQAETMMFALRPRLTSWTKVASSCAIVAVVTAASCAQDIKVTLLGTGNPRPVMSRFGPSILVEAGKEKLLFDCGRGATQRLYQLQV